MTGATSGQVWDRATVPEALRLAGEFEGRWHASVLGHRPDPADFVPADPGSDAGGTLLALLRVDLALRREAGEATPLEGYRERHLDLADDALVALIYEEFCLREEAGEAPDPADYAARFPDLAAPLAEILQIHDFVKLPPTGSTRPDDSPGADLHFPESGQTIGGFFLVEELGRGSFARVFLARERPLADRLVALKVSRAGSREPQALARLQHTHIVPVHSYRIDPATGYHLLCMPYFGRVTLARVLDDPTLATARRGDALVAALDRLLAAEGGSEGRHAAHEALARRSYPRAIAWWGARMADALRHAHERGVLHRDLKPSNVLIAADGTPMLLDFNLAREVGLAAPDAGKLGGTLAYMAPEHLAALLDGHDEGIDHRADLYALGLILTEMLGTRPPAGPSRPSDPRQLLERRRAGVLPLERRSPPIPAGLVAVIARCLAVDPADRYASASDLAGDLAAVAEDDPLPTAREPWAARTGRWLRRNVGVLVASGLVTIAVAGAVVIWSEARSAALQVEAEVRALIRDGSRSSGVGEFVAAAVQLDLAADRASGRPGLDALRREALRRAEAARAAEAARDRADAFFGRAEPLRFAILGFGGDRAAASADLAAAFKPLGVLTAANWADDPALGRLDPGRQARLRREVDDLLFFWVVAAAQAPADPAESPAARDGRDQNAIAYCDRALRFTADRDPWLALRHWWEDRAADDRPTPRLPDRDDQGGAGACFRWYLLGTLGGEGDRPSALRWLARATRLEPGNYWHQFALAFEHAQLGDRAVARAHYDAAIALRPDFPWAWKDRGLLAEELGDWGAALDDLARALLACRSPAERAGVRVELGRAHQRLGDFAAARTDYDAALALDPAAPAARAARRDRARLEAGSGATDRAFALYDELIAADPADGRSRLGRANLRLRRGQPAAALVDLDAILAEAPGSPLAAEAHRARASARLALGDLAAAAADADLAVAAGSGHPAAGRLRDRIRLARGLDLDRWPESPAAFDDLPLAGASLRGDLVAAADRLLGTIGPREQAPDLRLRRAVLLSAARDEPAALAEVDRVLASSPGSTAAWLVQARVRHRAGQLDRALADVAAGLAVAPEDPALLKLRGMIEVDCGQAGPGFADLADAYHRGLPSARGAVMAAALGALGRHEAAAEVWAELVEADPDDPRAHLGLATARRRLGQWDRALASLESAAALVEPGTPAAWRVALAYTACLPARPDRLGRVLALLGVRPEGR